MGSIVEAAIYEYIGKFFLIFVVVPVGIMVLGYIICIIVEVINEISRKENPNRGKRKESTQVKKLISVVMTIAVLLSASQPVWAIEETDEVDAVAASGNLIVVVPGIIKRVGK